MTPDVWREVEHNPQLVAEMRRTQPFAITANIIISGGTAAPDPQASEAVVVMGTQANTDGTTNNDGGAQKNNT